MGTLKMLPKVKKCIEQEGVITINEMRLSRESTKEECSILARGIGKNVTQGNEANLYAHHQAYLGEEGYILDITKQVITIAYGTFRGLFYAGITLKHLLKQYGSQLPCMYIEDKPDLPVRGVLYDISRNKVPKLETLLHLVDLWADLKYNQVQLYVEGLSFEYDDYKAYLREGCYITKEEVKKLQHYCKERFVDLVPNQNTLGHMEEWLALDDFKHLRENPEGAMAFGMLQKPSTLSPIYPESYELVENMTKDMLGVFESQYYNPNLDETFGLGEGASKILVDKIGKEGVYIDWVKKMYELAKAHNRKMVMWSDIILAYPEKISKLPSDITLMDWGYEDHYPFNQDGQKLKESGLDFYVCPGTSSWLSLTGRTNNMFGNVDKAVVCAHEYGAKGLIMTDWGDLGHWQTLAMSYPGFVYGAARAWRKEAVSEKELATYLDTYVFEDKAKQMGALSLNAGRCHQFEDFRLLNGTMFYHHFKMGLCTKEEVEVYIQKMKNWMVPYARTFLEDGGRELIKQLENRKPFDYEGVTTYIQNLKEVLESTQLQCQDAKQLLSEYEQALSLTQVSADLRKYVETVDEMCDQEKIDYLVRLQSDLRENMSCYKENWLRRNKTSDLEKSMELFNLLEIQIREAIQVFARG